MPILPVSQAGTVIEIYVPTQLLFESSFTTRKLSNARQELWLYHFEQNKQTKLCSAELGLTRAERVITSSCLFLQPGRYRWAHKIYLEGSIKPDYVNFERQFPMAADDFGNGNPVRIYENRGAGTIVTTMSGQNGRRMYAKGSVKYDLAAGEQLTMQVVVKNMSTGAITQTAVTTIKGDDADTRDTNVMPYFFANGVLFEISLLISTNAVKKPECVLIHQELP